MTSRMEASVGTVERAFQLAQQCASLKSIRTKLKSEGYANVDAHLSGRQIRSALVKLLKEQEH